MAGKGYGNNDNDFEVVESFVAAETGNNKCNVLVNVFVCLFVVDAQFYLGVMNSADAVHRDADTEICEHKLFPEICGHQAFCYLREG